MVHLDPGPPEGEERLVIEPNRSMNWRQSLAFLSGLGLVLLSIGGTFAYLGLWMVLPYSGLELAVLAWAFHQVSRSGARREVVTLSDRELRVEQGRIRGRRGRGGPERRYVFPRDWVRVRLEPQGASPPWHASRLLVGAHGRLVELGEFLPEGERRALAAHLGRRLAARHDRAGLDT